MFLKKARRVWSGVRSGDDGDADAGSGAGAAEVDDAGRSTPESKLFRCPECDVVYLALEKENCSSCRNEVREVPGSLSDD